MLTEIRITDLGVIDEAVLELGPGLSVVTGETGAGKTMVVTSLSLLLGSRSDAGLVRIGADKAVVEGLVELPESHPALERAAQAGGDVVDGLVLVRTVSAEGRSRAHVGGRAAPVSLLTELGEQLVAIHGQADQWRLKRLHQHRELLDAAGGAELGQVLARYREVHREHADLTSQLTQLRQHARERAQEAQALQTGLDLIEQVDPAPGEDVELTALSERLGHLEQLRVATDEAQVILAGDDEVYGAGAPGVLDALARAKGALGPVVDVDPALRALADRLAEVTHLVADLAADVAGYRADLDIEPGRLDEVHGRRARLAELTRLYGADIDAVLEWSRHAAARLGGLLGDDERVATLERDLAALSEQRAATAHELTEARERAAARLGESITDELGRLAMASTRLTVQVRPLAALTADGADEVELMIGEHDGADLRSITRAASGGELSRIMLAIEVATATESALVPTFVFDEVDAGVGGRAAVAVGARLAALARHTQVIVVTHLPQVAAFADHHLVVTKAKSGSVSRSDVRVVRGEERVDELARMLSGTVSEVAREHARALLTDGAAATS